MTNPTTGQLAMDIICGEWGAAGCSPKRWFQFMGDVSAYVPFQITYMPQPNIEPVDGYTPSDPKTTPCNQAVDVSPSHFTFLFMPCILIDFRAN